MIYSTSSIPRWVKLGGFTSALQYLDGEIVCRNSVIQNQQFKSRLQQSQIVQRTQLVPVVLSDGHLGDRAFTGDQSLGLI